MKKILLSLTTVGIVAALALGFSGAFFSDTETSTGNVLQAGKVDLLIDNTSYLNGVLNPGTTWTADNLPGHLFFNFSDSRSAIDLINRYRLLPQKLVITMEI